MPTAGIKAKKGGNRCVRKPNGRLLKVGILKVNRGKEMLINWKPNVVFDHRRSASKF
jgi:hypothetical protein